MRLVDFAEVGQRRKDINQFDKCVGCLPVACSTGGSNDQWHSRVEFEVGCFAPQILFAKVVAMIAPQNDDRVVTQTLRIQLCEHSSYLCIDVADAGVVGMFDSPLSFVRNRASLWLVCVSTKFAGTV